MGILTRSHKNEFICLLHVFTINSYKFVQLDIILLSATKKEDATKGSKIGLSLLTVGFLLFTGYLIYALIK